MGNHVHRAGSCALGMELVVMSLHTAQAHRTTVCSLGTVVVPFAQETQICPLFILCTKAFPALASP